MTIRYAVVGVGWISQIAFMPGNPSDQKFQDDRFGHRLA